MERLTDIDSYCAMVGCDFSQCIRENCYDKKLYDKLKTYEDAEEQGLLLRLPCKVGDTVYSAYKRALPRIVQKIEITTRGIYVIDGLGQMFLFGKDAFLTKEEAEQALARMEGGNEMQRL